jgi:hypothetical protein
METEYYSQSVIPFAAILGMQTTWQSYSIFNIPISMYRCFQCGEFSTLRLFSPLALNMMYLTLNPLKTQRSMRKFALCPVCLVASTGFKFYGKDAFGPNSPGQSLVCAPTGVLDFVCRKILSDLVLGNVDKMEPHDACRSIGFCLRMDDQGRPYPAGKDMPQLLPKKSASPAPPAAPAAPGAPASAPVVSKITPKHEDDDDDDEDEEVRSTKNEHKEDDDDEDADDEDDEFPSSRPVPSKTVSIINPEPITTNTLDKIAPPVFVPISVEPTASRPEVTAALSMPYAPSTMPSSSARLLDTGSPEAVVGSETPSSAPVTPPSAP